jgi:hypothetical protein
MSIPRRSARLAAKTASSAIPSVTNVPTIPTIPTIPTTTTFSDPPRICYDCNHQDYQKCSTIIWQYLKDIGIVRGKISKAVVAICLMRFLSEHPTFITGHHRFRDILQQKMEEFQQETIPDAELHLEFQLHVVNILFLLQQV